MSNILVKASQRVLRNKCRCLDCQKPTLAAKPLLEPEVLPCLLPLVLLWHPYFLLQISGLDALKQVIGVVLGNLFEDCSLRRSWGLNPKRYDESPVMHEESKWV